jgi:hypothetical protein
MLALPTFFIVGAPKSGTTSLHAYLAEHPGIAMTTVKECMLFAAPEWRARIADYAALFPREAPVRGESSTAYSSYPYAPEVPERVAATVPGARVVYVVREPVERVLAHYAQNVWDRLPVRPFDELMDDLEDPLNMPVWCSRYATQLERWRAVVAPVRILVLDQRDLLDRRVETIQRVCGFLGADPAFESPAWTVEHNTADGHRRPTRLSRRFGRRGRLVPKPVLRADQRERLVALLRPEMERFRELTGQRFEHWSS